MCIEGYLVRMSHSVYVAAWKTSGDLAPTRADVFVYADTAFIGARCCELIGCVKA